MVQRTVSNPADGTAAGHLLDCCRAHDCRAPAYLNVQLASETQVIGPEQQLAQGIDAAICALLQEPGCVCCKPVTAGYGDHEARGSSVTKQPC